MYTRNVISEFYEFFRGLAPPGFKSHQQLAAVSFQNEPGWTKQTANRTNPRK